jgi:hypothetical protein
VNETPSDEAAPQGRGVSDLGIQWRIFLGISAFVALSAAVYWFASYEQAGTTLLALASGLSLLSGGYLLLQDRRGVDTHQERGPGRPDRAAVPSDHAGGGDAELYLPHSSVWPLVVGLGAVLAVNGMILSLAYAAPGVVLVAAGLAGMAMQSRRRG